MSNPSQEERFDELLADYFRWSDAADGSEVDDFARATERWTGERHLLDRLRDFVDDSQDIQRIAASTLSHWLDSDSSTLAFDSRRLEDAIPEHPLKIGDFELLEELGRGGMGVVYRAHQKSLDRIVCTKMILSGRLAGQRDVERFLAEAKAMAALRHPNIVAVYEVNSHDDQYFYSMEYVPGQTLADEVREGPLTADRAAKYLQAISKAIAYAHEEGVLHRDLKPSNIIVDQNNVPRVMDFGLARQIDTGALTSTGSLAGTPSYMAPELTKGDRNAGVECDIYGLGAILYEMITARPPFQGETPLDTLLQVRQIEPARPSLLNPRVHQDLETICLKCLHKNPAQRYATATEVVEELTRYLRREPIHARPVSPITRFGSWCRRNPLPVALIATVIVSLLAVSGILLQWNWAQTVAYGKLADSKLETEDANKSLRKERNRLQLAEAANVELIASLKKERRQVEQHLDLSRVRRAHQAVAYGDLLEVETLLRELSPAEGEPDRRGWEWHYLRAISRQYQASFDDHHGLVSAVSISVDKRRIATLDAAGNIRLIDSLTNRADLVATVSDASGSLDWSQHSNLIAIGLNDGRVRLFDVRVRGEEDAARETSPRMAAVEMREMATGRQSSIRSLSWSPDGNELACGLDDGTIVIFDGARTVRSARLVHSDGINSLSWSQDGRWIASASDDYSARVTETSDLQSSTIVSRFNDWVNAIAFSPQEFCVAAVSGDGQFQIWNLDAVDGKILPSLRFSRSNPRGTLLAALAWSSDGNRLVTAGEAADISIWSAESGQRERQLYGHTARVRALDWVDTELVSVGDDGSAKIWNTDRSPEGEVISDSTAPVRFVTCHRTQALVAWRDVDGVVSIWDGQRFGIPTRFAESITSATALAWHPTEPKIALTRDESVLIYDLLDDSYLVQFVPKPTDSDRPELADSVWHIRWSPDGERIAASGPGNEITLWDWQSEKRTRLLPDHGNGVKDFIWTEDASRIISIDGEAVLRVWNVAEETVLDRIALDTPLVKSMSLSADESRVAITTEDGRISIVSLESSQVTKRLRGHQGATWNCVWASDDQRLISGGQDGLIRVWHVESGQEALRLPAHSAAVWSLDLGANGQLVSASADGTVRLWGNSD